MKRLGRFERLKRFRQLTQVLCLKKKGIEFSRKRDSKMSLLYLDTETTGLDPLTCELVTLQLMTPSGKTVLLKDPVSLEQYKPILESSIVVCHNAKFDSKFLKYHYGITLHTVYDTYLAEIALSGGRLARRKCALILFLISLILILKEFIPIFGSMELNLAGSPVENRTYNSSQAGSKSGELYSLPNLETS